MRDFVAFEADRFSSLHAIIASSHEKLEFTFLGLHTEKQMYQSDNQEAKKNKY